MAGGVATPGKGPLQTRHSALAKKDADLGARRVAHDAAVPRLGWYGVRVSGLALATVKDGEVMLSNAAFRQLRRKGPWKVGGALYPDLRSLSIAEATRRMRHRKRAEFRVEGPRRTLLARVERSRRDGRPVFLLSFADVSVEVRRDQELQRSRATLLQRERLRVLGELAAAVAHDLGNTLRGASFQATVLSDSELSGERSRQMMDSIRRRIDLASEAVSRLHDFARGGTLGTTTVQLDQVIRQAASLLDAELQARPRRTKIAIDLEPLPPIRGAVGELSYLFVNLLRNALEAMPRGGTIAVSGRVRGDSIVVAVLDEGGGIAKAYARRLFQPFFTTKGAAGTGLGLWLARGTLQRVGGSIRASNRRDRKGAMFELEFPVTRSRMPRRVAADDQRDTPAPPPALPGRRSARQRSPSGARGRGRPSGR